MDPTWVTCDLLAQSYTAKHCGQTQSEEPDNVIDLFYVHCTAF